MDKKAMIKEHLMSESHKGENMFDIATSTSVVSRRETEHTSKRSVQATTFISTPPFNSNIPSIKEKTDDVSPETKTNSEIKTMFNNSEIAQKTTDSVSLTTNAHEDGHSSRSFNRKFAFIHNEDNSTNSYTTPIPTNVQNADRKSIQSIANISSDSYHGNKDSLPRPDNAGYGNPAAPSTTRDNQNRYYHGNERQLPPLRRDPFSGNRNPYSVNPNRMIENSGNSRISPYPTIERIPPPPLPPNPQRLVDNPNPARPMWNAPKTPVSEVIPGQLHSHPPLQSHPIEIHEVPNKWESNPNRADSAHRTPPNVHYNILNMRDDDNRQSRVVTTSPNFQDRSKDIKSSHAWGSNAQQQSSVQIQRPLEILDHPNQRHDRLHGYHGPHPPNNQPRPVEIPHNQERNPNTHYPQDHFNNPRYDYNRVHMQQPRPVELPNQPARPVEISNQPPRPIELPNQPPNASPHWNSQNKMNAPVPPPAHFNSNNKWVNNNPSQDSRPPIRNQNRPEEIQTPQRQPYPQPPVRQIPQRSEDKWRNNQGNQNSASANSAPGRNNFYASQPQYRPSEVIATTQKSVPEEVPLSLAILVGEDGKSQNSAQQKPKQQWRSPPQYNRGLQRHNIINSKYFISISP